MSWSLYVKWHRRFQEHQLSGEEQHQEVHGKRMQYLETLPEYLRGFPWEFGSPPRLRRGDRVIVVGAGFAGLTAAWLLSELKINVTVLEARDRVGGRVHSVKGLTPGRLVEG